MLVTRPSHHAVSFEEMQENIMISLRKYDLGKTVAMYNSVGLKSRNIVFLTKWIYDISKNFSYLPTVDSNYREKLAKNKTKLTIFGILVDDLADNYKIRNHDLLEKAIRIPWNPHVEYQNDYLEVIRKMWLDIMNSLEQYPRYEEFKDIFFFDLDQFMDSTRYAYLINTMELDNILELKTYSPHNMMSLLFFDMDLMCSTNFKKETLKKIRPLFHWVQDITHIGNILSTYPREIYELDFSSPIISMGLIEGIITKEDVVKRPKLALEKLKFLVPYLKKRAEEDFEKIKDYANVIEEIDINDFYNRVRKVYESFLEREHYWDASEKEELLQPIIQVIPNYTVKWVRM